ncbi:MAG: hypothetical protein MUP68_08740, partial [Deltaproteobacteria bacterium]|nr:hypothetical protein [Deltaproteobacteria bacterium]
PACAEPAPYLIRGTTSVRLRRTAFAGVTAFPTFYEAIKIRVDIVLNERQHISKKQGSRPSRR